MDYKIVVIYGNGHTEQINCATETDVENWIVNRLRSHLGPKQRDHVSFDVFYLGSSI